MTEVTIADAGIIVASLNRREQWHKWTAEQMAQLRPPFITCDAVITEACYLLRDEVQHGEQKVISLLTQGALQADFSSKDEIIRIQALMKKYENVPMSFADACLVRMSELKPKAKVFTLDSDFWIYRKNGAEQIPLIIPHK